MTRVWKTSGCGKITLAICLALGSGACSSMTTQPQPITHIVLLWLKHPGSATDRAQLARAAHSLCMMPGVLRVETGRTVPVPNAETNRDFDLGVVITFRDRAALERFERDPRHADALQRYLRPLVRRYVVYDLGTR